MKSWHTIQLLALAGHALAGLVLRNSAVEIDPRDACPGYKVVDVSHGASSLVANLELAGEPCDAYGVDIRNLTMKLTLESGMKHRDAT